MRRERNQSSCLQILRPGRLSIGAFARLSTFFLQRSMAVIMKFQKLEKIDHTKFTSLDNDQETFSVGGGTGFTTHLGTMTPAGHDIGTDMVSDV
jgi:hypothetical protein